MKQKPATESQIAYAISLGIDFPADISKDGLTYLITMKEEGDVFPTEYEKGLARCFFVDIPEYVGKKALFDRIKWALNEPGKESELVLWFVFRVYCQLSKNTTSIPIKNPRQAVLVEIADHLSHSKQIIKSIRRYHGRDLINFGTFYSENGQSKQGGSINTIAYDETASLLSEKLGLPYTSANEKPKTSPPPPLPPKNTQKNNSQVENQIRSIVLFVVFFFLYLIFHK